MKQLAIIVLLIYSVAGNAQELFLATEPASNKPDGTITFRIDQSMMDEMGTSKINYHLIPEIMAGITKKLMVTGNLFFSNRQDEFRLEGGSVYLKYRFLSNDQVQQHFRMAVFGRISYNNSDIHQEEVDLNGHNSGMEAGIVATELLRKVALSSSLKYTDAANNGNGNKFVYGQEKSKAISYSFSGGKLLLPKTYSSYRQTNFNLMMECLTQINTGSGKYYIDLLPSVQFIVRSQGRMDIGYRKELASTMLRTAPNGMYIRLEYNFFNAF